jgi:long-chain fatty acid transport protein
MKRSIKLAVSAALALGATSAFATNGDNLIGLGAKTRGMGGVGIATSFGAESALANPALITTVEKNEIMFGGTLFMPNVEFGSNTFNNAAAATAYAFGAAPAPTASAPIDTEKSTADTSVIPEVALASRINDNFVIGVGMYGVAGMGTDYRDTLDEATGISDNGSFGMRTNFQLLRFAIPVAYEIQGFSVGIAPMLQYGSLNIMYAMPKDSNGDGAPDTIDPEGTGVSEDFGFGYEIGVAYNFEKIGVKGLTVGAKYQSAIDMKYDYTLSSASEAFGLSGIDDHLEQPAEIGIGVSYDILGSGHTVAIDYKQIQWGDAKGYKDFEWENQSVIAVGYEYAANTWAVRLGYNYGQNPIKEQDGASMMAAGEYEGAVKNFFNLAGFPAITEQHMTVGGTYKFSKMISVDLAVVYAPEVSESYDTSAMGQGLAYNMAGGDDNMAVAMTAAGATQNSSADVKHSQFGGSLALNYAF